MLSVPSLNNGVATCVRCVVGVYVLTCCCVLCSSSEVFVTLLPPATESHTDKHGRQYVMVHSKKTVDYVGSTSADDSHLELQRRRMQLDRRYIHACAHTYVHILHSVVSVW